MSGFEVAGVVLGSFPIAITILEKYREVATRIGLFYKIRLEYKKWRDDLEFHQLLFTRQLRRLLLPLVVDGDRIDALLAAPGSDDWRDPTIAVLLKERLGASHRLYREFINGMNSVVKEINKELSIDGVAIQKQMQGTVSCTRLRRPPLGVEKLRETHLAVARRTYHDGQVAFWPLQTQVQQQ